MKHLFIVPFLALTFNLSAQTVYFNQIDQNQGLRNGNVRAIIKDHQGFLWFGTEDGLHRYDGYSMKVYRYDPDDSTSLGNNFILCLYEDSDQNLWIGTLGGGLYLYDRKQDSFRNYLLPSRQGSSDQVSIRSIAEGRDNYLYVGSDILMRSRIKDPHLMKFDRVPLPSDTISDPGIRVLSIQHDLDSNLLVSVYTVGLFKYDIVTGESYPHQSHFGEKHIQTIYVDRKRNLIWFGTWGNGLLVYDPINKKLKRIVRGIDLKSLRNNFVPSIAGDTTGNIWIATDNGLSLVPWDSHPFEDLKILTFSQKSLNYTGLSGNIIKSLYVDNQDRVWVGTYYEGVNVYDRHKMNFGSIVMPTGQSNVSACETDQSGNLWLGTDGEGLYYLKGGIEKRNFPKNSKHLSPGSNKIRSMKMDDNQILWIGTWGNGLLRYNTVNDECIRVPDSTLGEEIGDYIISVNVDTSENVWIGSFDKGFFRYNLAKNEIEKINSSKPNPHLVDRINAIYIGSFENIWIGKELGGLHLLSKGDSIYKKIQTEHLNISTTIFTIYEDKSGILWLGAPDLGLIRYNPSENESIVYGNNHGLLNKSIYAIEEDSQNRLWVSHNAGLSVFDKRTEKFTNFTKFNGLTSNQFNKNSSTKLKNGYMAFGNIHGLNFFNPREYQVKEEFTPIVFTNLWINNSQQEVGEGVLDESIITTNKVRLEHDQHSFSIEFAELDYDFSKSALYYYQLEGFDKSWQIADGRRLISYTNLPPGEYVFKVKSASKESSGTNQLKISISPAWWQTIFFKITLILILIFGVFTVHRLRIRFLVRQRKLLEDQVKTRTRKLNEANEELNSKVEEIHSMNNLLKKQHNEIQGMNNEILAQNEELQSQNEQISLHREKLEEVNSHLEEIVNERTEKLRHTVSELSKTVFELDRFVYSASHDLSAPLKSIQGLVQIMRLEKDRSKILECTDRISGTVNKLEIVIRNMVDFSRNSHALIKSEPVNIKELINEIISEVEFKKGETQVYFDNLINHEFIVKTDRFRLKVILYNLIVNAIKFSDNQKQTSWIKLEGNLNGKYCQLTITDNGTGIQKKHLGEIFNMYFRGSELSDGAGLGLFIVKEMMEKINGSIKVESEIGSYTSFELHIPNL